MAIVWILCKQTGTIFRQESIFKDVTELKFGRIKLAAAVFTAAAVLAGCGGSSLEAPYPAPEWALEIATPSTSDMEIVQSAVKVDVYYDNTESMYGFASDGTGGSEGSNVVRMVTALRDVIHQYTNTTTYTLTGSTLSWTPFDGDLRTSMADYQGFYTVNGSFAAGTGPLQMLYYEEAVLDPTAINVVITDLAEQNVDCSELAAKINEHILSQDGYSAVLIGIMGDFNGTKYISEIDKVTTRMPGTEVNGRVPIYMLLTGPDKALDTYVDNLLSAFHNYELAENDDYYVARYHAGNSARVLSQSDIISVGAAKEQDGMKKSDWQTAEINENLSMVNIDAAHLDTLIQTDGYLNMFAYRYDTDANGINTNRITLNYFLPIERTDGLDLPIQLKVYETEEQAATTQVNELYSTKDRIRYSELVVGEDAASAAEMMENDAAVTDAFEITEKESVTVAGWKDIKQISRDKDMTISLEVIPAGTPVYDMVLQADGRDAEDLYASVDLGLAAETDLLHIQIEFSKDPEEREGSTVLLSIPVYAMAESVQELPAWISEWDSAGSGDYIYHTLGLENFYRTLFGLNVTGDADYDRALREVKIADVLTCVTDLPTS